MKFTKETKVGLLTLLALVILYVGFNFLKGVDFLNPSNRYYVVYDNVDGLEISNSVELNGYRIGRVNNIVLLQDAALTRMLVELDITDDLELYQGSEAILADENPVLGGKLIRLNIQKQGKLLQDGDTLRGTSDVSLSKMIQDKADPLIGRVDTTIASVNSILESLDSSGGEVEQTLIQLKETSRLLRMMVVENRRDINAITNNIRQLTESINDPENGIKPFLAELNQLADTLNNGQLSATLASAQQSMARLETISKKLEQGEGSLGKLLTNDSLYQALTRSSSDLDKLLLDIQQHPERYIDLRFSLIGIGGSGKD